MGPRPDRDGAPLCGFEPVHRVAQSYLGSLWVAVDKRGSDATGEDRRTLLRRVCLPEKTSAEVRRAIARAASDARNLQHVNILSVLEVLEDGPELGVVYEHLEAEPLRALQASATLRRLSFPIAVSLRIGIDLLMGLRSLHQAHAGARTLPAIGGLTPDSVLVARNGETKLCDVLVASCASLLDEVGSNTAKLGYAAPEQVNPIVPLTAQCDLFTVGVMLWELLTSRRLLAGSRALIERKLLEHDLPSLGDVRGAEAVCPALAGIIDASLSADPGKRPTSALAMAEQLRQCGHFVASREEVAEFIAKLSSQRFEKRSMSLSALQAQPAAEIESSPSTSEEYEKTWIGTAPPANEPSHSGAPAHDGALDSHEVTVSLGRKPPSPAPAVVRCDPPAAPTGGATEQASGDRKDPSVIIVQSEAPSAAAPSSSTMASMMSSSAATSTAASSSGLSSAVIAPPRATRGARLPMPNRGSLPRMEAVSASAARAPFPAPATPTAQAAPSPAAQAASSPAAQAAPSPDAAPPVDIVRAKMAPARTGPAKVAPANAPAPKEAPAIAAPAKPAPAVAAPAKPAIQQTTPHVAHPAFMSTRNTGAGADPLARGASAAASLLAVPKATPAATPPKLAAPTLATPSAAAPMAATPMAATPPALAPKSPASPATTPLGSAPRAGLERTMIGVGLPAFLVNPPRPLPTAAEPAAPVAALTPSRSEPPAPRESFPVPSADFEVVAEDPAPSSDRHAFSLPPTPIEAVPDEGSWRGSAGVVSYNPSVTPVSPRASRQRKVTLALLGMALGVALAFGIGSLMESAPAESSPAAAAIVPAADLRAEAPGPGVAEATPDPALAGSAPAVDGTAASPPPNGAAAPAPAAPAEAEEGSTPARDFNVAKLDDGQLAEWFQLERRKALPSCAERLGKKVKYSGKQPIQSRTKVKAARAALLRGKLDLAYTELCVATAHDPGNLDAQRSLAELALDMGDPARAREAAERGLAKAPKDAELRGLLGDALALSNDIPGARRAWLELDKKGLESQRRQRLVTSFVKAGDKAASSSKLARARSYHRRALVLTEGGYGPSMGLGEALLVLGEPRAGLAWAERAARAQPKSARAQLLLGDAYAKNGKPKDARAAWQTARRLEPKNKVVALRLSRGLR